MALKKHPNLQVVQGETFKRYRITLDGDYSDWIPRGQIRTNFLELGGELVALFEFDPPVYDASTNKTTISPFLSEASTVGMPITGPNLTGWYFYDIELVKNGEVYKQVPGRVGVLGEVTDNSTVYNPPVIWSGSIHHIELEQEIGDLKIYRVWGDEGEQVDLGTFEIKDGRGLDSESYDPETGVLTLNFTDSTSYQTGDLRAVLSAEEIKTRYESNGNTNAFTDSEKTALSTALQPASISDFETTSQLNVRDTANRLWTNLTNAPSWITNSAAFGQSLVTAASASAVKALLTLTKTDVGLGDVDNTSDLDKPISLSTQSALDGKEPADSTILKESDIGVNVQGYSPYTVIDLNYVSTEENYTTLEKSKLGGIEAGAQVNVNSDWNANSGDAQILNKPTLGTAAATASSDYATASQGELASTALQPAAITNFETTSQLNSRDTNNRARANHTGTQAISTVSGLQTALNSKEPADGTILKGADIGVTVQGYSEHTVIDPNYVATQENYTTSEKSKLGGIEAGAQVNVNSDWNANSGDAQILNKPILGTASATDANEYATAAQATWNLTNVKTSGYIAVTNDRIPCNTSAGSFTITLPSAGRVSVFDIVGKTPTEGFGVNSLFLTPDVGSTVIGESSLEIDIGASAIDLYKVGNDWRISGGITSAINASLATVAGSTIVDGSITESKLDAAINTANRSRTNHTGTQLAITISDFTTASQAVIDNTAFVFEGGDSTTNFYPIILDMGASA